jgi:hypothetical protein
MARRGKRGGRGRAGKKAARSSREGYSRRRFESKRARESFEEKKSEFAIPTGEVRSLHFKLGLLVGPMQRVEFEERGLGEAYDIISEVYEKLTVLLGMRMSNPDEEEYFEDDEDEIIEVY